MRNRVIEGLDDNRNYNLTETRDSQKLLNSLLNSIVSERSLN